MKSKLEALSRKDQTRDRARNKGMGWFLGLEKFRSMQFRNRARDRTKEESKNKMGLLRDNNYLIIDNTRRNLKRSFKFVEN